jgi:ubiquinone/menaquinone biosynthesis C-methylase UbiE
MREEKPSLAFTGERYTPEISGDIFLEHMHRYLVAAGLAGGKRVLDIACGEGYGSERLARSAASVVGVDIDPEAVAHAQRRYGRQGLEFRVGSCDAIPLKDQSVDLAVSFETLEHHSQHEAMLRELKRVLRPGGLLLISCPDRLHYSDRHGIDNAFHVQELHAEEFEALVRRHFSQVCLYDQKTVIASAIQARTDNGGPWRTFRREAGAIEEGGRLTEASYNIALASDAGLPLLPAGLMEDIDAVVTPWTLQKMHRVEDELRVLRNHVRDLQTSKAWRWVERYWRAKQRMKLLLAGRPALAEVQADPSPVEPSIWRPLRLTVTEQAPVRVNLLLPKLSPGLLYAGTLGFLQLGMRLAQEGSRVRLLLHETSVLPEDDLAAELEAGSLRGFLDWVEVAAVGNRDAIPAHPQDRFVAFSHVSAHLAHGACQGLAEKRFLFFVQEFEPLFFVAGSAYAKALESYHLPQRRLYSTPTLKAFFEREFPGQTTGESPVVENAVAGAPPSLAALQSRRKRRLLVYARLQSHTSRNLADLGLQALREAIEDGDFDPRHWEFWGIGNNDPMDDIPLARGSRLRLIPRLRLDRYYGLLPQFDLGLSLMLSPHPSLTPLDMAAAGMPVLTNSFADKTAAALAAISPNILAVEATLQGLREGLRLARDRSFDHESRLQGAQLNWARNWGSAFQPALPMLREFLGEAAQAWP